MKTDATCNTQQCCVRLHGATRSVLFIVEEFVRVGNMLFIIKTSAKVESGKLGTLQFCCFQLNQPNYIDSDDVIRTTTALHDFSFLFQVRILQFKKGGKRNVCCLYLNDAIVRIVHHVRFVKVLNVFVV